MVSEPPARLWLVFFADPRGVAWWCRCLRPGYRHCYAASWYHDADRWIVFHPTRRGHVIECFTAEAFPARLTQFLAESSTVLRVASRHSRWTAPAMAWCVAEIKALLGVRSWAMTPWRLSRDLLARGAEIVAPDPPCVAATPEVAAPSAS